MMAPPKPKTDGLPKRVYEKHGAWWFVDVANKWHKLCRVSDGQQQLYRSLSELLGTEADTRGDLPKRIDEWLKIALPGLSVSEQKETERMALATATAFEDFNVSQVDPGEVHDFLQNNFIVDGKLRTAQRYRAVLNKFFSWCQIKRYRTDNPCVPIRLKEPPKRDRYITHQEYHAIRDAMLIGEDGKPTRSGEMMQCFMDLCYLTGQRSTDVRLLKWGQVDRNAGVIKFKPTKTAGSSGAKVDIPISSAINDVLKRAQQLGTVKGLFVIHTLKGSGYTTSGVGSAWERACTRAAVDGATIKDLRAKHATDAKTAGYQMADIQEALAHGEESTTRGYIKSKSTNLSKVELNMPKK